MFDKKLDILMRLLDISNTELARAIFIDPSYISRLRTGKRKLPKSKKTFTQWQTSLLNKQVNVEKEKFYPI